MGFMSGFAVYVMIWTVVLFMVLPWKVRVPEIPGEGHASSAPENPYIWQKLVITSLISLVLLFAFDWVISGDDFSFRE
ncbi:DUF1467 family protein [Candidatus Bealeia paramacronuclearis]|uniref:DUF1467 family protein n=1 Tax=Candidatus Bealeia paramacronuclearis TaxID=1921001 RepID=A0ABZ2C606_9PROT|nr:hypothetical protein [Candidatus Bealeia paramacronuclearis]